MTNLKKYLVAIMMISAFIFSCSSDENSLDNEIGEIPFKLKSGQVLFFPIIYPHSVNKVTKGSRKALIGWLSTNVSYEQSFVLRNLYEVNAHAINNKQL